MLRKVSFTLIGVLIVASYAVPYLVLASVSAWYGSFLFWTLVGVFTIVLNLMATAGFKDDSK
ncbi:hypothetical protein [Lentibacter sp. XHP0401]|jgi:predicted membrane channel-forming protein YqfA (hemolysin III family)|uniref:hypothetical protein n=1 Tax=Lentibacter sp. XHP0401 TaxID=2984334 RepID=UPI0021E72BED|nr:hypothetical protein [Lentibacter sp. XHP0401]MCV2892870.1 hypothetical protein [Lentibacter sp. XHP0401]